MLHNRFPWKRSGRRSSMWSHHSLRRNLSAAACRPCDRSLRGIHRWPVNSPARRASKGAVTCAVCPESAWLVTFLIGNVSTGVVTWSALRCGASGESGKNGAAAPLSKTAAAAAAAKTWFVKQPLDYMLHNRFPWKRSGRRSSMWPPYSLRRNLSAAACRPCDRSFNNAENVSIWWRHHETRKLAWKLYILNYNHISQG